MNDRPSARPNRRRRLAERALARGAVVLMLLLVVGLVVEGAVPTQAAWVDVLFAEGVAESAPLVPATDVVAGNRHSCALVAGEVWCTGDNSRGQLGTGTTTSATILVGPVGGELAGKKVTKIDAGNLHTCAVTDESVYCWGDNSVGQIGVGGATHYTRPVKIPPGHKTGAVAELELGATGSCLVADAKGYCWGETHGPAGTTSAPVEITGGAVPAGAKVTDIAIGTGLGCLLADGVPYCWGTNDLGQLGNGKKIASKTPVAVDRSGVLKGVEILDISVGGKSACVIGRETKQWEVLQSPYCWGDNRKGQLGKGSTGDTSSVPVTTLFGGEIHGTPVTTVDLGEDTACAKKSTGIVYCWGNNSLGQTGTNNDWGLIVDQPREMDRGSMNLLMPVGEYARFATIDVDATHGCGVGSNGLIYCWGGNGSGELGTKVTLAPNPEPPRAIRPVVTNPSWTRWDS